MKELMDNGPLQGKFIMFIVNAKSIYPHSPIKYRPTSTAPVPCAAANGGLLIMAAEKPQFSCVFAREFCVNPKFDLEPVYVIRKGISR